MHQHFSLLKSAFGKALCLLFAGLLWLMSSCGGGSRESNIENVVTTGSIIVSANVAGAKVNIDNNASVILSDSKQHTFQNVREGSHNIRIEFEYKNTVLSDFRTVSMKRGEALTVSFVLNPNGNSTPVAHAGVDIVGFSGTQYNREGWNGAEVVYTSVPISIALDGTGSTDPDGDTLSVLWSQTSGPSVALASASSLTPTFVPQSEGFYEFKLVVNDGFLSSPPDSVIVTVHKPSGKLAIATGFENKSGTDIFIIDADGGNLTQVTDLPVDGGRYTFPSWFDDGNSIAFACNDKINTQICSINIDGTNFKTLTGGSNYSTTPDVSPDGKHITYSSGPLGIYDIYSMNPDGSENTRLTQTGKNNYVPEFSFDGSRILFVTDYGSDNWEVMTIGADGQGLMRMTNNATVENNAAWMPDNRILFISSDPPLGQYDKSITIIDLNGSVLNEFDVPSGARWITNPVVSNDGRYVFFTDYSGNIWVLLSDGSASINLGLPGNYIDYCECQ